MRHIKPDKTEIRVHVGTKMNNQKKRNMMLIVACCFLILSLCLIQNTLAKYASQTKGVADMNIARWDIIVNDEHVKENRDTTAVITPHYVDNPNVAPGVIAPGSIGYFDVTIKKGDTDVSFDYEIKVLPNSSADVTDIKLYQYSKDGGAHLLDIEDDKITGEMLMSNPTITEHTLRIYVKWVDNVTDENLSNDADTIIGHDATNKDASIKVNMKFKQVV